MSGLGKVTKTSNHGLWSVQKGKGKETTVVVKKKKKKRVYA